MAENLQEFMIDSVRSEKRSDISELLVFKAMTLVLSNSAAFHFFYKTFFRIGAMNGVLDCILPIVVGRR